MDILEEGNLSPDEALGHWYYRSKFELLSRHLRASAKPPGDGASLADVGCGLGLFLRMLRRDGWPAEALTGVDTGFRAPAVDPVGGFPLLPAWPEGKRFDVVLLMDVLEHCADDGALLAEATDRLAPGGTLFLTVPAFNWLWSAHDVFLKHQRRYDRRAVRALIAKEPRLELIRLHYFYGLLFPAAVVQRLRHRKDQAPESSQLKKLPVPLDRLFFALCRLETTFMVWNRWAGLSVVAVCRRRGS